MGGLSPESPTGKSGINGTGGKLPVIMRIASYFSNCTEYQTIFFNMISK